MKVNILGTEYKIIYSLDYEKYPLLKKSDGYCDHSLKLIVVADYKKEEDTIGDLEHLKKKTARHELIHAFMYESGLWQNSIDDWAINEEMTDWIAIQFPKIAKSYKKLGVEE